MYLPILWVLMVFSRFLMKMILSPLLAYFGTTISSNETSIFVWGGVRGGLSLTIAMMIMVDPLIPARC